MLRKLIFVFIAVAIAGAAVLWFVTMPATVSASALGPHTPNLDNGKTMFNAGGCVSCHAVPDATDRTRLAGGMALPSPFGTFYAPNVSQHMTDGIGGWSEAQFVTAMTKGTSPSGAHYFPAFPYTSYQRMTSGDLRDLFAFMKTLPAAEGRVRDHDLAFPYSIRRAVGVWKFLNLDGKAFTPDPAQSAQWNRGAYLVNGPGHCAECHSPRNALGGIVASQRFAGGPNPEGKGWVPNITQKGLADWSASDIAYMLESGQLPDGDSVGSNMAPVVRNTAQLSAADRDAMAAYIKSLPAVDGPARPGR